MSSSQGNASLCMPITALMFGMTRRHILLDTTYTFMQVT